MMVKLLGWIFGMGAILFGSVSVVCLTMSVCELKPCGRRFWLWLFFAILSVVIGVLGIHSIV
jgi:hypothetical protein